MRVCAHLIPTLALGESGDRKVVGEGSLAAPAGFSSPARIPVRNNSTFPNSSALA